ncbi:type II toxin-antitoxin system RelE/ParE family toxin [Bosea sp. (in: a-proteobacteria)]|uniref:type II toxin-antitoxin system RelE/ParE family toxin n=1 Tax=Bosea sp. (in: a-proteobacteria) TaxID=1871050 RepID=UPI004034A557
MPGPEWLPVARDDLMSIIGYIADDNPDAAQRLKDEIEARVAKLIAFPDRFRPGRVEGTREMSAGPNRVVVYATGGATIRILRVLHAARQWPPDSD